MIIYLIRHGKPDIDKNICYGCSDVNIKPEEQLHTYQIISDKIAIDYLEAMYASPLKRCSGLAEMFRETIPIYTDDRLIEYNFGTWELQSWDYIDQKELADWCENFITQPSPGGESFIDVLNRSNSFWNDIIFKPYNHIGVITHAGVMRSILSTLLDIPLNTISLLKIKYSEVIQLRALDITNWEVTFL